MLFHRGQDYKGSREYQVWLDFSKVSAMLADSRYLKLNFNLVSVHVDWLQVNGVWVTTDSDEEQRVANHGWN